MLDTCVWIDLAKAGNGEKLLNILERFIQEDEVSILLPETVQAEFLKNEDRIIKGELKAVTHHFKRVRELAFYHGDKEIKENFISGLNNLEHRIPIMGDIISYSIDRIHEIFSSAGTLNITEKIKLKAAERAIDKKAPFHLSKNSMGDSLIIETFREYKIQNQNDRVFFITYNKNDFSLMHGDKNKPHEDLEEIFNSERSQYFIDVLAALREVNSTMLDELIYEYDWQPEIRGITEIWGMQKELI